jgi:hypothetical protein
MRPEMVAVRETTAITAITGLQEDGAGKEPFR